MTKPDRTFETKIDYCGGQSAIAYIRMGQEDPWLVYNDTGEWIPEDQCNGTAELMTWGSACKKIASFVQRKLESEIYSE